MKIGILHDLYLPLESNGVSGEDNLVNLEITLLRELGHEVIDMRRHIEGFKRKIFQASVHASGFGNAPNFLDKSIDLIHAHNLNQLSGYSWLKDSKVPVVQSLHNLRSFCTISIGWRNGENCFECLESPTAVIQNRCGGIYGISGSFRHLVTQRSKPQLSHPARFIASSQMMKTLFSKVIDKKKIDVIHNPGVRKTLVDLDNFDERWLFAGRFTEEKGILDIVRNWPEHEQLDIAGDGPLFQQISLEIRGKSNIRLIGTFSSENKGIYSKYRGLIFASSWMEGSPLVVADAISNGLPVIAFGTSAVKEQMEKTHGGVYYGKRVTPEGLEAAFFQIRSAGISLRRKCYQSGVEILSPEIWIKMIEKSFLQALN